MSPIREYHVRFSLTKISVLFFTRESQVSSKSWYNAGLFRFLKILCLVLISLSCFLIKMQNSKLKRKAMLANTVANSTGSFAYDDSGVKTTSFSMIKKSQGLT